MKGVVPAFALPGRNGALESSRSPVCATRFGAAKKELYGYDPRTTNNRMELMAAIQGLLAFREPCEVDITTDAEYVRQGITQYLRSCHHTQRYIMYCR